MSCRRGQSDDCQAASGQAAGCSSQNASDSPQCGHEIPLATAAQRARRWLALTLLLAMNLFNYVDRQILAAVEPEIRQSLLLASDPQDQNAMAKMGLLSSAFLVSYMLAAPVFGVLATRGSRWVLVAVGVGLWSLATGAGGLAATYGTLLATRCFVGIGEGAYGPLAPAILSDLYPASSRGKVLTAFYVAIPVGGALGYMTAD